MRPLLRAVCELFIPDNEGRRAFEETLADWRYSRSLAPTRPMRLWTDAQGLASLVRVTLFSAGWQMFHRNVWRTLAWTVVASAAGAVLMMAVPLSAMPIRASSAERATIAILMLPSAFAIVFALAGSIGLGTRREHAAPVVGQMLAAAVVIFLLVGWVIPAANQKFITAVYAALSQDQTSTSLERKQVRLPVTGLGELSLPKVVAAWRSDRPDESAAAARRLSRTAALTIAGPTFLLLGVAVRRRWMPRGSWRLAQLASGAAVIAAVTAGKFAAQLMYVGNYLRPGMAGAELWPILVVAWLITAVALRTRHQALST